MSRDWTEQELEAASRYMQKMGQMSYEEFCKELERQSDKVPDFKEREEHEKEKAG